MHANKFSIYTIGTSNRPLTEFLDLLKHYHIELIIDVRHFPSSRFEHFKKENLQISLAQQGIGYLYLGKTLGGYRPDGYASYMETSEFRQGLRQLKYHASKNISCITCAERLFTKCHRKYIAEALARNGWKVWHIIAKETASEELYEQMSLF